MPARVTEAESPVAAPPACTVVERPLGDTAMVSGTGAAVIRSVSYTVRLPVVPAAFTVIVSTYVPAANPAALRLQRTLPLPDPACVTKLSHPDRLVAVQARVEDPVPAMVTEAESPVAAPPACTVVERPLGETAMVSGTGAAVIRRVSNTVAGDPTAPDEVTAIVST